MSRLFRSFYARLSTLFLLLILLWGGAMAFLASLGLGPQQAGAPAMVGLFAGIFIFMGFTWSVIGE